MLTRVAALGPARLVRPAPVTTPTSVIMRSPHTAAGPSPVELVRPVLQHLADVAADAEGLPRHPVPELGPHALGDQLAVLARDVLALAGGADDMITDPPARPLTADDLDDVARRLADLRRALP